MKISDRVNKSSRPAALLLLLSLTPVALAMNPKAQALLLQSVKESEYVQTRNASLRHITQACTLDPDNAVCWRQKGIILNLMDEQEEALPCLEKSLKLDDKDCVAWNNYAATLTSLRRYPEALTAIERAQKIHDTPLGRITRAAVFAKLQKYEAAENELDIAVKLDPNEVMARIRRPSISAKLGHWDKVIADQNYLIPINKANSYGMAGHLQSRAYAYTQLKQYDKAIADYKEALKSNPDMRQLHAGLLDSYRRKGDAAGIKSETAKLQAIDDDMRPSK